MLVILIKLIQSNTVVCLVLPILIKICTHFQIEIAYGYTNSRKAMGYLGVRVLYILTLLYMPWRLDMSSKV